MSRGDILFLVEGESEKIFLMDLLKHHGGIYFDSNHIFLDKIDKQIKVIHMNDLYDQINIVYNNWLKLNIVVITDFDDKDANNQIKKVEEDFEDYIKNNKLIILKQNKNLEDSLNSLIKDSPCPIKGKEEKLLDCMKYNFNYSKKRANMSFIIKLCIKINTKIDLEISRSKHGIFSLYKKV